MQLKQVNRIRMFHTVESLLEDNKAVWSAMAPFATSFEVFKARVAAVEEAARKQQTPIAGATLDRESAREDLEDVLFLACEALGVLAHQSGDNHLLALTDLSRSDLQALNDTELNSRATAIREKAAAHATQLVPFQVTQANLDELGEALDEFNNSRSAPRTAVANRMAQTESLPMLMNEANDILRNRLDRMVNLFQRTNPDFVAAYRGARVVVDLVATRETKPPVHPQPPQPQGS